MITRLLLIATLLFFPAPVLALDLVDLSQPESIAVDPRTGNYYISNVNGTPGEKDNNGYISKVSPDGLVVVIKFIEPKEGGVELHAPKGLVVEDETLFVTDIDSVKGFRLDTGENTHFIDFGAFEARFLNDIAVDSSGDLYVSDMLTDRIFKVGLKKGPEVTVFKEGPELGQPNGLFFNHHTGSLLVATWRAGRVLEIKKNGELKVLRDDLADGLDGIAADKKGTLFVSSFTKGEIYSISRWGKGSLTLFTSGLTTPADIHFDSQQQVLLVPLMNEGKVTSFSTRDFNGRSPRPLSEKEKARQRK